MSLLARIIKIKLIELVREKEGISYSTDVKSLMSSIIPNYGYFMMETDIAQDKFDAVEKLFADIVRDIRNNPIDENLLKRARKPMIKAILNSVKYNSYWLRALQRIQTAPKTIKKIQRKVVIDILERTTADGMRTIAHRYLRPETLFKVRVIYEGYK